MFCYNGTPLENVQEFKYLGMTLSHNGRMTDASNQMACSLAGAITRVWRICSESGIKNRKQAMLWIFQAFALSAGYHMMRMSPALITPILDCSQEVRPAGGIISSAQPIRLFLLTSNKMSLTIFHALSLYQTLWSQLEFREQQHRVPYELRICTMRLASCARRGACTFRLPKCRLKVT